jgi:hypothetical protein
VQDLPLQVREIDDIAIDQTDGADTGGSEIESGRRAEPPGTDEQDLRLVQLHLALATYVAENNLTAVSLNLLLGEFHSWIVLSAVSYQLSASNHKNFSELNAES